MRNIFALIFTTLVSLHVFALVPTHNPACFVNVDPNYAPTTHAARGYSFDIDDNILNMPTKIMLFNKKTGKEVGISTATFAEVRSSVGTSGEYKDYELREDQKTGSLRYFGDEYKKGQNNFLKDLKTVVEHSEDCAWQGPAWAAFVKAMAFENTARTSSFITARRHSPQTIFEALKYFKKNGYIKNLPNVENIFPVSYPKFQPRFKDFPAGAAASTNPSAKKAEVMLRLLDELQARKVDAEAPLIQNQNGNGEARLNTWGFSDDDLGNYQKALDVLRPEVAKGRWPNVKITLFFTGKNASKPQEVVVIKNDGTLRPRNEKEALSK